MGLASWTPLPEAQRMLNTLAASRRPAGANLRWLCAARCRPHTLWGFTSHGGGAQPGGMADATPVIPADAAAAGPQPGDAAGPAERGEDLDFDTWQALQLPMALCTACAACGAGVRLRAMLKSTVFRVEFLGVDQLSLAYGNHTAKTDAALCRRRLALSACKAVIG